MKTPTEFERGQIVKHSKHYFYTLKQAGCTEKSLEHEKKMVFKVVEIPARHGSFSSIGIVSIDDDSTIIACTKKDIVVCE